MKSGDTASVETDPSQSESVDTSIDQYKQIHCEEYAMRCNAYSEIEQCEEMFDRWFRRTVRSWTKTPLMSV